MAGYLCNHGGKSLLKCVNNSHLIKHLAAFHGRSRIGNRDVVGFGINGGYMYVDRIDYPMPSIRFKENTPQSDALREKEKGDWKKLTLDEKKALYRHSFCLTFSEQRAPTGDWKYNIGGLLCCVSMMLWGYYCMKKFVYPPMPCTMTPEHQSKMLETMIHLRVDPVTGLTSKYDYVNNRWKD